MRIDAGLDTGDILLQEEMPIAAEDTSETLAPRLAAMGAELMLTTLRGLQAGAIQARKQEDSQASLAPILKKEDGLVDFSRSGSEIFNRLRGFQPWPGAYTKFRGKTLQIFKARPVAGTVGQGELSVETNRLIVGCGQDSGLELLEIQVEGKKRTSARDFIQGYRPQAGEHLPS
jgi:methionyl-tRNA formyltransferase